MIKILSKIQLQNVPVWDGIVKIKLHASLLILVISH